MIYKYEVSYIDTTLGFPCHMFCRCNADTEEDVPIVLKLNMENVSDLVIKEVWKPSYLEEDPD